MANFSNRFNLCSVAKNIRLPGSEILSMYFLIKKAAETPEKLMLGSNAVKVVINQCKLSASKEILLYEIHLKFSLHCTEIKISNKVGISQENNSFVSY